MTCLATPTFRLLDERVGWDPRPADGLTGVVIERDRWGIPHVFADRLGDLGFGFGYAMAQDRLFQMDYLRRKGLGRHLSGADCPGDRPSSGRVPGVLHAAGAQPARSAG